MSPCGWPPARTAIPSKFGSSTADPASHRLTATGVRPFQRRDDHSTGTGAGVGLGLAIARGFVHAMHGTLTLDDTPGGGLTAVIALPKAPDSTATRAISQALDQASP